MERERGFHNEMLRLYEDATTFGYYPTYFLGMVQELGGVAAAKQLLKGSDISDGLTRLWEEERLDISMEALILQEPWRSLFNDAELNRARRRLEDLGYDPGTTG